MSNISFANRKEYFPTSLPGSLVTRPIKFDQQIEIVEELLKDECFTDEEKIILAADIKKIVQEKEYHTFATALKKRKWAEAFHMLADNPGLALRFMRRLPVSFRYRWNALRRGGTIQ